MKLIDEKEVEEAANSYAHLMKSDLKSKLMCRNDFNAGVAFAEQKLQPMMIEFAEWCNESYIHTKNKGIWISWDYSDKNKYTTEQLLEQFLKTKQK